MYLRPLTHDDSGAMQKIASDRMIADTTISIPHPLDMSAAEAWVTKMCQDVAEGHSLHWILTDDASSAMIGSILLRDIDHEHHLAELGFWIGRDWWGKGYTTEALQCVVDFGFRELLLNRLYAFHMVRNPASGAVLAKAGFKQEGIMRQRVCKWGIFEDVVVQGMLVDDWRGK